MDEKGAVALEAFDLATGTAPKPSQGGDLPEREASKLNATHATGRPYNHRLGMPLADS